MNIEYIKSGDYYIPNLKLSEEKRSMPHTFFSSFAITATLQSNLSQFSLPAAVLRIPVAWGCSFLDL